jgi:hypothetical protein
MVVYRLVTKGLMDESNSSRLATAEVQPKTLHGTKGTVTLP